ncbi:MAG: shikimate kinase [Firmicutes bacterium]|nr:shikimate kinase [Bacillota bacterium]
MGDKAVATTKYALLSRNPEGSISVKAFDKLGGIDYDCIRIENKADIEAALKDESYGGYLVANPFKDAVVELCDELSDAATTIGGVTTILRREDGSLLGCNFDMQSFVSLIPEDVDGWKAVILGTGVAARTAAAGLLVLGAKPIIHVADNPDEAVTYFDEEQVITYNELRYHKDAKIMVNATEIGRYPRNGVSPLDGKMIKMSAFRQLELAIDMNHNPSRTKFLQDAERCAGKENKLVIQKLVGNLTDRIRGVRHTGFHKSASENLHSTSRVYTHSGMDMVVRQIMYSRELWRGNNPLNISTDEVVQLKRELLEDQINVVLIGMPGSGKSSIAKMMAKETRREFIDVDRITERLMGDKIANALVDEERGEAYVREYETQAIREACSHSRCIIATGGGAVLRPVNRDIIRENGCVVYIRRPLDQLSLKNRPLSQKKGVENLYKERVGLYYKAADVVVTNSYTFGETVDKNGGKNSYTYDLKRFAYKVIRASYAKLDDMIAMHSYKYEQADKHRKKRSK